MIRHFIDLEQLSAEQLRLILATAAAWKTAAQPAKVAADKTLIMLFDKPSTRTRLSFEIAFNKLGGDVLCLDSAASQLSRGESIADTIRVFNRYADAVVWRTEDHENLEREAAVAEVPIINGLTARSHPCQIVADLLTLIEAKGEIEKQTVVWFGDCNNVTRSWVEAANLLGFELALVSPKKHSFAATELGAVKLYEEIPAEVLKRADCITTDTWFSMNNRRNKAKREAMLKYQVNAALMAQAPQAVFLHCLPATRGDEVTAEVIDDAKRSMVWQESENRIHAQKAILAWCLGGI